MMMRTLLIVATIIGISTTAFAQTAPKVGGKPLKQVKPPAPMGCKLVGTVRGTKLGRATVWPRRSFGEPHPRPSLQSQRPPNQVRQLPNNR